MGISPLDISLPPTRNNNDMKTSYVRNRARLAGASTLAAVTALPGVAAQTTTPVIDINPIIELIMAMIVPLLTLSILGLFIGEAMGMFDRFKKK